MVNRFFAWYCDASTLGFLITFFWRILYTWVVLVCLRLGSTLVDSLGSYKIILSIKWWLIVNCGVTLLASHVIRFWTFWKIKATSQFSQFITRLVGNLWSLNLLLIEQWICMFLINMLRSASLQKVMLMLRIRKQEIK